MFSHLLTFLFSILSSLIAWLVTVKIGDSFKQKPWSRIVLVLAVFGFVFIILTALQKITEQPSQQQSGVTLGPTTTTKNTAPQRRESEPRAAKSKQQPVKYASDSVVTHGEFTADPYKFTVNSLQKNGTTAIASVTLESLSNKEIYFTILSRSCYLVDESGERWTIDGYDPARFIEAGTSIVPHTKIKSKFSFTALDSTAGSQFTFICTEASPSYGRKIVVRDLSFQ